ncbi:MAG: hypothetical protein NVSMB48_03120 [Marmoricola sp.]
MVIRAALTLQITHTEKPMCSEKIEKIRLRRATCRPPLFQNVGSSGSQCAIQRPREDAGAVFDSGAVKVVMP